MTKIYSAIVEGWVERDAWTIDAALGKDENSVVAIRDWVREDGVTSQTQVEAVKRFMRGGERFTVCRVKPLTGRKHQIRIHLAWAGHSIVGDKLYGPDERLYLRFIAGELSDREREEILRTPHHALHCGLLSWDEPSGEKRFEAVAEAWFREFGQV